MARRSFLLVGEGYTDIGAPNVDWASLGPDTSVDELNYDSFDDFHGGAIRELCLRHFEESNIPREAIEIVPIPVSQIRKHGGGYPGKLKAAIVQAELEGYVGLIFVLDRDRDRSLAESLFAVRDSFQECQMPTAIGVCVETVEAWLLADPQAVSESLQIDPSFLPPNPEKLNGKPGNSDHPKDALEELINRSPLNLEVGHIYKEIAKLTRLDLLSRNCPEGFGRFQRELDRLLS